jgi:hypothetical protein
VDARAVEIAHGEASSRAPAIVRRRSTRRCARSNRRPTSPSSRAGFTLERTRGDATFASSSRHSLARHGERRVWLADGNAFFNRPGPRIVESLEILAACLHPEELADLGHAQHASFALLDAR